MLLSIYDLQFEADGEEIETIPLTHDSNQLETCVNQGRFQCCGSLLIDFVMLK